MKSSPLAVMVGPALAICLVLTGCGSSSSTGSSPSTSIPASTPADEHDEHDHEHDDHGEEGGTKNEDARVPRLAFTHTGGVTVVDATTLKPVKTLDHDGDLRLRASGNARHPLLDAGTELIPLDLGSWTQAHGDHGDSKTTTPSLGTPLSAAKVGHVSPNGELTAIFDDGDGSVEVYNTADLGKADAKPVRTLTLPPHHGNAIPLADGALLHSIADGDDAKGIRIIDASGKTLAESTQCPGQHGSAVAKGAVVIGCEDGVLIVKGTVITKVKAGPAYARIGNLFGSPDQRWVLGDYKLSADAKPTQVVVIDTETATMKTVDLKAAYTFRGLGITADGDPVVLTNDGNLRVIHAEHAEVEQTVKVVAPFTEPTDWRQPRPTLYTQGHWAYVTDPATKKVHGIELSVGKVMVTGTLPHTPNEVVGTLG
ncbi:hypothetical protein ACQCX5_07070 [Propionibacteriaceae bacterium G57]|uniref:hypothetical protein n=1 Tax=Aestuariimicrobium sp. G57 TaxID=3418485 RepID=UPI003DA6E707